MKRILVTQNEQNSGVSYLIVNGELVNDQDKVVFYGRVFSKTDNWKEVYKDDYLEIRIDENQLLIKSFYNNKDVIGRAIYYMYLIDEVDDINRILDFLETDSKLLARTIDRESVQLILEKIRNNKILKKKIEKVAIAVVLVSLGLTIAYLLIKNKI